MRENELAACRKQSFRPRTTVAGNGAVPNLIKDLEPSGVDQVWVSDGTNLWIFPKGMERSGEAGRNSLRWTSKYGSVIASGIDVSTTDGLNEAGLFSNLLCLAEFQISTFCPSKAGLSSHRCARDSSDILPH